LQASRAAALGDLGWWASLIDPVDHVGSRP
jgi:hypothetical protein